MSNSRSSAHIGDYELIVKLGEGGMGAVYKARQMSLDRIVALKILPRRFAADKKYVERFLREARATAKLNHPNIVAGIDVGSADGYHYFAMELVEGATLRSKIETDQKLPEDEVLRIGSAIASALAHAHAAKIVHRDVKPDNILLAHDGTPKLADLGLAKAQENASMTTAGIVVGTPHYMAPEQARDEEHIDGRADTYALGCTLFHAATGAPPFNGTTTAVIMVKHLNEKLPHPQSLNPALSDEFCQILSHMIARDSADRYQDLGEAAGDMEALRHGKELNFGPLPSEKINFQSGPAQANSNKKIRSAERTAAPRTPLAPRTPAGAARAANAATPPPSANERKSDKASQERAAPAQRKPMPIWIPIAGAAVCLAAVALLFGGGNTNKTTAKDSAKQTAAAQPPVEKAGDAARTPPTQPAIAEPRPKVNPQTIVPVPSPSLPIAMTPPPTPVSTPIPVPTPNVAPAPAEKVVTVAAPPVSANQKFVAYLTPPGPPPDDPEYKNPVSPQALMNRFSFGCTLKASASFRLGWSASRDVLEYVQFDADGAPALLRATRSKTAPLQIEEVARGQVKAPSMQQVSVSVDTNAVKAAVNGTPALSSDRATANKDVRRDLFISVDAKGTLDLQKVAVHAGPQ